jgi:hypothetical protein
VYDSIDVYIFDTRYTLDTRWTRGTWKQVYQVVLTPCGTTLLLSNTKSKYVFNIVFTATKLRPATHTPDGLERRQTRSSACHRAPLDVAGVAARRLLHP